MTQQLSLTLARRAYGAIEAFRVAAQCLADMHEAGADHEMSCLPDRAAIAMAAIALQERIVADRPATPDDVFTTLRTFTNRCPRNTSGIEAVMLLLQLGLDELDVALDVVLDADADEYDDDLVDCLFGAFAVAETVLSSQESVTIHCNEIGRRAILAAMVAGEPLPELDPRAMYVPTKEEIDLMLA